jgi:hypothetical protein
VRNPPVFDLELTVEKVVGIDLVNIQPERYAPCNAAPGHRMC